MVLYQEGFEVDGLRPHLKKDQKKNKNGYSRCLRVKAGNEHSYPQHINYILSVKLRFSSVFVFLHFMVNLIEDERALQSCSTTITSLSVSSRAGNDGLSNDLLLQTKLSVLRKDRTRPFYLLLCLAQRLHVSIQGVAKNDVYL